MTDPYHGAPFDDSRSEIGATLAVLLDERQAEAVLRDGCGRDVEGIVKRIISRFGRNSSPAMYRGAAGIISEGVYERERVRYGRRCGRFASALCVCLVGRRLSDPNNTRAKRNTRPLLV